MNRYPSLVTTGRGEPRPKPWEEATHVRTAAQIFDSLAPKITALKGCRSVTVFGDDSDGQYGLFVLWASDADANAGAPVVRPQLMGIIEAHLRWEPEARLFEALSG